MAVANERMTAALIASALVSGIAACSSPAVPAGPPLLRDGARGRHVLLVTIDTLRRDRLGSHGHPGGLTPTLDALAGRGMRATHAMAHAPQTLPSHASILTGLVPPHHRLHLNGAARLGDDVPTLATIFKAAGYRTGAFVGAFVLDDRYGLGRGFDVYDDRLSGRGQTGFVYAERRADAVVQAAGDWILAPGSSPWLAWVHLFDPHAPYDAPPAQPPVRSGYDGEVAYTDAMLGRLLDRLGQAGLLDRTVIAVTADHGESLGDHGERTHGLFAYDATLAVPLIVAGPGVRAGLIEAPVAHVDVLPTLAGLAGVAVPPALDGQSLTEAVAADRPLYFEALDANLTRGWAPLTGVVVNRWKYIHLPERELYDRVADPGETTNLAAAETERVDTLERERRRWSERAGKAAQAVAGDGAAERRLRALGYVGGAAARPAVAGPSPPTDDPKRLVALNERFNAALEAFQAGRPDASLEMLDGVLATRPDFVTARTSAATVLLAAGKARQAVALLQAAPGAGDDREIQAKLGAARRDAGDLRGAAAALERARALGDTDPERANDLGVVYARLGRTDDARREFQRLLSIDPHSAMTWNNVGVLELSANRRDAAAAAFRRAVAADPAYGDAWQGLGAALADRDRAGAIEAWRRAEQLLPRDYDLLFNVAMALADSGRAADALPYLDRFLAEAPPGRYAADLDRVRAVRGRLRP
jgi:arylsulfatase A-like enzyme/Flp pilus assembly protein TadD